MTEVLTREKKAAWTAWRSAYKSGTGRKILRQTGRILLGAAPGFALAFSDICGVSAGAWAAYGMAAASCGLVTYPVSLGIAAAFLMRMLWGLTTRWELLIGAVLVLLSPHVLRQRNGAFPLIATGLALLPGAIIGVWQGSAATLLFGIGTILLGTLSAPVMCRAIESIRGGRSFETLEIRLSVGYLLLMLLCGGARMMLPYVNLGVTAAGLMTMAAAVYLGVCPGCVMGLMAGVTLALQGLPLSVTVALSLGGFLAGMGQMTGRRMVPCVLFARERAECWRTREQSRGEPWARRRLLRSSWACCRGRQTNFSVSRRGGFIRCPMRRGMRMPPMRSAAGKRRSAIWRALCRRPWDWVKSARRSGGRSICAPPARSGRRAGA